MDKHFLAFIPNFVVQIKLIFVVVAFVAVDVEPNIDVWPGMQQLLNSETPLSTHGSLRGVFSI